MYGHFICLAANSYTSGQHTHFALTNLADHQILRTANKQNVDILEYRHLDICKRIYLNKLLKRKKGRNGKEWIFLTMKVLHSPGEECLMTLNLPSLNHGGGLKCQLVSPPLRRMQSLQPQGHPST